MRVTMAGVAVTAVLTGAVRGIGLLNPDAFDALRIWEVGSLVGRNNSVLLAVLPFVVIGAVLAMGLARPLDAISMGDDLATAMGVPSGGSASSPSSRWCCCAEPRPPRPGRSASSG